MIERSALESALTKKGFTLEDGKDHRWYRYFNDEGKKTPVGTKISRGSQYKVYGDQLESAVAKQMHITKAQLRAFVDCSLSAEEYREAIKQQL